MAKHYRSAIIVQTGCCQILLLSYFNVNVSLFHFRLPLCLEHILYWCWLIQRAVVDREKGAGHFCSTYFSCIVLQYLSKPWKHFIPLTSSLHQNLVVVFVAVIQYYNIMLFKQLQNLSVYSKVSSRQHFCFLWSYCAYLACLPCLFCYSCLSLCPKYHISKQEAALLFKKDECRCCYSSHRPPHILNLPRDQFGIQQERHHSNAFINTNNGPIIPYY